MRHVEATVVTITSPTLARWFLALVGLGLSVGCSSAPRTTHEPPSATRPAPAAASAPSPEPSAPEPSPSEADTPQLRPANAEDLLFVIQGDRPYALITDGRELLPDAPPPTHVHKDAGWHLLAAPLGAVPSLPPIVPRTQAATLTVHDLSGTTCTAHPEPLVLFASVFEPDDLVDRRWSARAETLEDLENLHEGGATAGGYGAVAVAVPLRIEGDCPQPQWAWSDGAQAPWIAALEPASAELAQKVDAIVRDHPEVRRSQKEFRTEWGERGRWTAVKTPTGGPDEDNVGFDGLALRRAALTRSFTDAQGRPHVLYAVRNGGVCGEFFGAATLLWRVGEDGELTVVHEAFGWDAVVPDAVLDVDGDGRFELLERTQLYGQLTADPPRSFRTAILQPC